MPRRLAATISALAAVASCQFSAVDAIATPVDPSTTTTVSPVDTTSPITTTTSPPTTSLAPTTTLPILTARDVKVVSRVNTRDKVVFITIDDGFSPTSELAEVIRRHRVPITTFAMPRLVRRNEDWFLARKSMTFENHTVTHGSLTRRSLRVQKQEICRANDQIEKITGQRPTLFRPPGGNFTAKTKKALAHCGIKYLVMWSGMAEKNELNIRGGRLSRGDIILMHYIPSAASTLELLIAQMKRDGLRPALLRDYLD
ncbi:MAG: polysaccharide deacetylase family protein [Actinomycetota bacterium]